MPFRKSSRSFVGGAILLLLGLATSVSAHGPRWRRVNFGFVTTPMQAVYAFDSLHIWVSSYFQDIIYSKDGGFTWNSYLLGDCCPPVIGGIANSFFFFDSLNGWMAGQAYIDPPPQESFRLRTRDGGNSWSGQLDDGYNYGNQIFFVNPHKGFDVIGNACNYQDSFLVTNDSGKTWQARNTGLAACSIERLFFADSLNGWGISDHPAPNNTGIDLIRTRDGGNTWSVVPKTLPVCAHALIFFQDTLNGWMYHCSPNFSNQARFSRTRDGGITWDSLAGFGLSYGLYNFAVADTGHFWLAGYNNYYASVQFSSDGGRSWVEQMPGVDDDIVSLSAADSTHAFAVGVNGYVYIYAPQIPGDLNLDWQLTPADVVLMLNFVFLGRPVAVSPADMDFNDDCTVSVADVVLLLDKTFFGSPPLKWGRAGP